MKPNILKKFFFIALSGNLFFLFTCKGQSTGCVDSVTFNQFFPSYLGIPGPLGGAFRYTPQRDSFDNVFVSGGTAIGNTGYWSIMKFNTDNQIVWYKNYRTIIGSPFVAGGGNLHDIEPNGNLIFSNLNNNPYSQVISKTDKNGNFLWGKILQHANPAMLGGLNLPVVDDNGELFAIGRFNDDKEKPVVMALDAGGNIKWVKKYQHITVPKFHLQAYYVTSQNTSTIVLAVQYYYNADNTTDPAAKFGLQVVKINKADGSIGQQQSFMYYDDAAGTIPNRSAINNIKYSASAKNFILDFGLNLPGGRRSRLFTLLDDNFNIIKTTCLNSTEQVLALTKVIISNTNFITLINAIDGSNPQMLLYTILDNNLNIVNQRAINLDNLGFPHRNFQADLTYKKNGVLNFQLATYTTFLSDYFYLFDHSPFYGSTSPCLGIDSAIYQPVSIYAYPVTNPTIEEDGTVQLQSTDLVPDFPPVEFTIPRTEVCKQISICDTIKLFGTQYHCLSNPLDSFKIYRNPLCKRKTNWMVDTAAIKILNQNDTALHVQYLQPYRGSIKVGFGGCSLTDSIAIEVYDAKAGINLGNDTMYCPGKTITLKAGKGFKTYLWQNGTTLDSLVTTQPGTYSIMATDSCGNVFRDTLVINSFDVVLKADYLQPICLKDTAVITLPTALYNYTWQPANNASLNNYVWRLYPTNSITYTITGERLPGCTLSDTVLINVKLNCVADYIYFPTGFTPNGDGKNDFYKPSINGQLTVYEFTIFNRYGQPVFRTTSSSDGWDGRFKNSKKPLNGGYVWMCRYQFAGRPVQQEQGSFILIR